MVRAFLAADPVERSKIKSVGNAVGGGLIPQVRIYLIHPV
jgi:hypothetical protein